MYVPYGLDVVSINKRRIRKISKIKEIIKKSFKKLKNKKT